jgi:DNA polymerase III alpha subunit
MRITTHGTVVLTEPDILEGLYSKDLEDLGGVVVDDPQLVEQFNQAAISNADKFSPISVFEEIKVSIEEFDRINQSKWFMPQEYQDLDVGRWLLGQCDTDQERQRVEQELGIYDQYQMTMLLNYLKYLVDTMRSNNIVWGVGRGSSVASYCLYLIGVHKIDSLAFDLDIHEFLK